MKTIEITFVIEEGKEQEFWQVIGKVLEIDGVYKEMKAQYLDIADIEKELPF
jgi:hypothetical protein